MKYVLVFLLLIIGPVVISAANYLMGEFALQKSEVANVRFGSKADIEAPPVNGTKGEGARRSMP